MQPSATPLTLYFTQVSPSVHGDNAILHSSDSNEAAIFYLKNGYVKSYTITESGSASIVAFYGPDAIFPLRPTLKTSGFGRAYKCRSTVYFQAMTECEVYRRRSFDFLNFIETEPVHYREIVHRFMQNMELYASRSESLEYRYAQQRLAYQLLTLAEVFGMDAEHGVRLALPLNHQELAECSGMARETASRELEKLRQAGLVYTHNKTIHLPNVDGLNDILMNA